MQGETNSEIIDEITGIEKQYCNVALRALLEADLSILETKASDLLRFLPHYGKKDTLVLDAMPEIEIRDQLKRFDPNLLFLTEEMGRAHSEQVRSEIEVQPIVFVADPTDRSAFLEKYLKNLPRELKEKSFKEIISNEGIEQWETIAGKPAIISGATSAITGVMSGRPFFALILNYITQDLLVACQGGTRVFRIPRLSPSTPKKITIEDIFNEGEPVTFYGGEDFSLDDSKSFITFLGKEGYHENFEASGIFSSDSVRPLYDEPGGPARILYLSSLSDEKVGFILANGEKITEWIHWLPFLAVSEQGEQPLRVFEVWSFVKEGVLQQGIYKDQVLMAPSPVYSISFYDTETDSWRLDMPKLKNYPNPSRYRATLLATFKENSWVTSRMEQSNYRELKFRFRRKRGNR